MSLYFVFNTVIKKNHGFVYTDAIKIYINVINFKTLYDLVVLNVCVYMGCGRNVSIWVSCLLPWQSVLVNLGGVASEGAALRGSGWVCLFG